ncbi:MAG: hypothetical protein WCK05_14970 [Planctomycetota bacterium]
MKSYRIHLRRRPAAEDDPRYAQEVGHLLFVRQELQKQLAEAVQRIDVAVGQVQAARDPKRVKMLSRHLSTRGPSVARLLPHWGWWDVHGV